MPRACAAESVAECAPDSPLSCPAPPPSALQARTPLRVGCVLSGGQAPGGHNVISGLFDSLKRHHPSSELLGFLDGPKGLMTGAYKAVDDELIDRYRNTGGFDLLGSGRDKIEKPEEFEAAKKSAETLKLDGVIM